MTREEYDAIVWSDGNPLEGLSDKDVHDAYLFSLQHDLREDEVELAIGMEKVRRLQEKIEDRKDRIRKHLMEKPLDNSETK